ncbi:MAG: lipid A biosynthesis acyltransferase, partial [Opitutaceae bacterium]|nr:lipid A biosynthesis acyltransferase [Opitutaceae bacterium]
MSRRSERSDLWMPQHWPSWLGLALFRTLTALPWPVRRGLARGLAALVYHVVPIRRRVTLINLRLCFPEKSDREIRALARAHYGSLALGLFETCEAWWTAEEKLPPFRILGREHLDAALARGKGALFLTGHFTTLELCSRMAATTVPFGCMYRDPNNPVVASVMRDIREKRTAVAVHWDDLRGLLRALKQNLPIWYAPDQGKRTKMSEILPFFGVPALTNTATSRIAQMSGCAVVPYVGRRLPDGSYELEILPALEHFPSGDHGADAVRVNQIIEGFVRRAPE